MWVQASAACLIAAPVVVCNAANAENELNGPSPDPSGRPRDPESVRQLELARALRRARRAVAWERGWPHLARLLTVAGLFLAASWAGLWVVSPFSVRALAFAAFVLLVLAAVVPALRFRWPGRDDALRRLDRGTGIPHRPATALTDTLKSQDPVAQALWQESRARTLASVKRIRAGLPSPRLVLHVEQIMKRLRELGLAILLVEQNFALATSVADEIYVVSSGRFVFHGTPDELSREPDILDQHLGVAAKRH